MFTPILRIPIFGIFKYDTCITYFVLLYLLLYTRTEQCPVAIQTFVFKIKISFLNWFIIVLNILTYYIGTDFDIQTSSYFLVIEMFVLYTFGLSIIYNYVLNNL